MSGALEAQAERAPSNIGGGAPLSAAAWMAGSMLSFSLIAVAGRELSSDLNSFQIMFWRSIVGAIAVTALIMGTRRGLAQVKTRVPGLHAIRNLFHFFGQNCWFYAISLIPLAQVFAFEFTTPIWVTLLAPFVLGERFTGVRLGAAFLGFIGILIVARPGGGEFGLGHAIGLAAAVGFAVNVFATKRLSATETTLAILFWMTLSQAVMSLVCDLAVNGAEGLFSITGVQALWLLIVGLCGLSAHFCVASALRLADATVVAPLDFFRLPLIALVAAALYAEPLDPLVMIGGGLVFLGNFLNLRAESRSLEARLGGRKR